MREAQMLDQRLELAAIVETLADPVFGKALDGTIHSWNAGAERLYGYRAEEVVGRPVSILAPREQKREIDELLARLRRGETIEQFETVRRRKDGTDVHVSLSVSPVRSPSGEIVGAATIAHDISESKHREQIHLFLAEASRLLALNIDYRETLARVAELTLAHLADWCVVELAEGGSLTQVAAAHRDAHKAALARELRRRYPSDGSRRTISARVLATGKSELIPDVSEALLANLAQDDNHVRLLRRLGLRSLLVVPLRVRGRTLGAITLANAESGRRFDSQDLEVAEDLAGRAALAIDSATLHASEQAARRKAERAAERIGRLQVFTAALSEALTPTAVAAVLVREGAEAVGADGGFLRLLTDDGRALQLFAAAGFARRFEESVRTLPVGSSLPGAEVYRTGEMSTFESAAAVRSASPEFVLEHGATEHEAIAFLPLHAQGRPAGVVALSFAEPRSFDEDDRELLTTIANQCSLALERARLYEGERRAHSAAKEAVDRTTRLQSLAAQLAESLTSAQVARAAVTQGIASLGADAGALQLLVDGGKTLEIVSGQGSDPALISDAWLRLSTDLELPSTDALRRLEPVFIESEDDIRGRYPDAPEAPTLGARGGAHIPLVVSGQALGVLFLGFSEPRQFSEPQRAFVLALGRQCAQALKRAQLYEDELEARSRLSRLVEGLHEGVASVDRHSCVVFANSTARRMLGADSLEEGREVPDTWLGFPLRSFVAGLFTAGRKTVSAQLSSVDGERTFEVTGIPAAGAETALVVVQDVSERELRGRAEREFVSNAAHELRTPLASITSAIERLQAGARDIPEKRDRYLGHIQHESARLNRLAASLLVLARAETGEEEPRREQIVLCGLLAELTGSLEIAPDVELVLECPADLVVQSNRDLLEHALVNLVGNAARHTERGQIRLAARAGADGSVTIEIADTGTGIEAAEFSRLFDRFYRGPGEDRSGGFGLGLPITKEAVQAIGGRIEIESTAGVGTTARIALPGAAVEALA